MSLQAVSRTKKGPKPELTEEEAPLAKPESPESKTVDQFLSQPPPMETIISEWSAKQQGKARAKLEKRLTGQMKLEEHINDDGEIDAAEAQELKEYFPGELVEAMAYNRLFSKILYDMIPDLSESLGIPQSELRNLKHILHDGKITDKESKAMIAKIMNDCKAELGRIRGMARKSNEVVEDQATARRQVIEALKELISSKIGKDIRYPSGEMVLRRWAVWELSKGTSLNEILDGYRQIYRPDGEFNKFDIKFYKTLKKLW